MSDEAAQTPEEAVKLRGDPPRAGERYAAHPGGYENAAALVEGLRDRGHRHASTVADAAALAQFDEILRDELNVKAVDLVELDESVAESYGITRRLTVNARAAGPRLGKQVQHVIAGAKAGLWTEDADGAVVVDGILLEPSEYELALEAGGAAVGTAIALLNGGGFVLLDTATTPDLEAEGLARDIVRAVPESYMYGDRAIYLASLEKARTALCPDGLMTEEAVATAHRVVAQYYSGSAPVRPQAPGATYTNDFARRAKLKFQVA